MLAIQPTECIELSPPAWVPSGIVSLLGMVLTGAFGVLLVIALRGIAPSPLEAAFSGLLANPGSRLFLAAAGTVNLVLGLLVTVGFGERAAAIAAHHIGIRTIQETESPCRLVEDARGWWELRLEFRPDEAPRNGPTGWAEPEFPAAIAFRLDEAAAGTVSRFFDPGEVLRLRWLDLPATAGGPVLLEVRSRRRGRIARDWNDHEHRLAA